MSAKDAVLCRVHSHSVADESGGADGISKEEVYFDFTAKWRGKPVIVRMSADRYAASFDGVNKLTNWRTYSTGGRYGDDVTGRGGGDVSGTARSALSKLCEPLVMEWLASDAYTTSFQRAVALLIMRRFRDSYSAARDVARALDRFRDRLPAPVVKAISATLTAYDDYEAAKARAFEVIGVR